MSELLVVNTAPYGGEGPFDAFRLATIHDLAAATARSDKIISF